MWLITGLLGAGVLITYGWMESSAPLAGAGVVIMYLSAFTQGYNSGRYDNK